MKSFGFSSVEVYIENNFIFSKWMGTELANAIPITAAAIHPDTSLIIARLYGNEIPTSRKTPIYCVASNAS